MSFWSLPICFDVFCLFSMRAVCVRIFETSHIRVGWGAAFIFSLLSRHFATLFLPYISALGTACEQFSSVDLLALLLQLSVMAFFPVTCCYVWQLWVNVDWDTEIRCVGGCSRLGCTSSCQWTPVLSGFSCSQAGELLLPAHSTPRVRDACCAQALVGNKVTERVRFFFTELKIMDLILVTHLFQKLKESRCISRLTGFMLFSFLLWGQGAEEKHGKSVKMEKE